MKEQLTLQLYDRPVQFTPDGKVFIVDAIKAVTDSKRPNEIWGVLQEKHPELLDYCDDYSSSEKETALVTDSDGWEKIMFTLVDYLSSD